MTKTHTMRSRLISLVLVLVMVLGCLPLSALAVGTGDRATIESVSFTAPEKVVANQTYSLDFEVKVKIDATKFGEGRDITTSLYLNFARSSGKFTLAGAGQVKVATITVDGATDQVGSVISNGVYDVTTLEQQDYAKTLKITGAIQYTPTAAVTDGEIYAVVELRDPNGNAVEINQKSGNVSSTLINTDQVTLTVIADNVSLTFQGDNAPYDATSGSKTVSCGSRVQFTLTPDTDWKITDVYAYITSDLTVIEVKKVGSDYYFTVPEADEFSEPDNMRVVLFVDTVSTAKTATKMEVTTASSVIAGSVLTATATLKNQAGDRTITGAEGGQMMFTWPDGSITYGYLDDEGNAVSSWTVTDDYAASLTMADREKTVTAKFFGTETYASSEGTSANVTIGSRTIKAAAGASIVATPTTGGTAVGTLTAKTTYQLALSTGAVLSSQGFAVAVDSYTATWYESDGAGGWNNLNTAAPEVTPANVGKQYKVSIKPSGQYTQGAFELVIGCAELADSAVTVNTDKAILTEGETLLVRATVTSNGSNASGGVVVFVNDEGTQLGTGNVINGFAKIELTNLAAGEHKIAARYLGAEGVYAASQSAAVTVTVKSAELPADGWSIKVGDTANGTLTVAAENALSIDAPAGYSADDYRVEWLVSKDGGETWALVDTTDTIKVTPANRLYQYRAIVYPDGKYTKPAGGISVTKVTCGTGDASYLPTAITLTAIPGTEVFENEGFTIRAQVTSNNKPVTSGLVTFSYGSGETYVSAIDAGGFAEFPVPNGVTVETTYEAAYEDNSEIYAASRDQITITVKSREIRLSDNTANAAITVKGDMEVGSTVTLTAPLVYAKDATRADQYLTVGKDFYYQWQFSTDYNANPETATWLNFSAPAVGTEGRAIRVTIGDANTAFRVVAMPYGNYMYPATGVATAAVCGNSAKVETTIDSLVVRSVSHGGNVYEGDDVQIMATVKAGNDPVTEGIVVFSVKTASGNSRTIGTAAVNAKGEAVLDYTAYKDQMASVSAQYYGNAKYADSDVVTETMTIKSVEIAVQTGITAGTLTVGSEAAVNLPVVVIKGSTTTLTIGKDYYIQWLVDNGSGWSEEDKQYDNTPYTFTPANENSKLAAVVFPMGNYTLPAEGVSAGVLSKAKTIETTTTLTVDSTDYEGSTAIVTAKVETKDKKAVLDGLVEFYVQYGVEGSGDYTKYTFATSRLNKNGEAAVTFEVPIYSIGTYQFYAHYVGTEVYGASSSGWSTKTDIKSATIAFGTSPAIAISNADGPVAATAVQVGETYTLTAPEVYEKGTAKVLTCGTDYYYIWQYSADGSTWETVQSDVTAAGNVLKNAVFGNENAEYRAIAYPMGGSGSIYRYPANGIVVATSLTAAVRDTETTLTVSNYYARRSTTGYELSVFPEGRTVILTAAVEDAVDGDPAYGVVEFYTDTNDFVGAVNLDPAGMATISFAVTAFTGDCNFKAVYQGNTVFKTSEDSEKGTILSNKIVLESDDITVTDATGETVAATDLVVGTPYTLTGAKANIESWKSRTMEADLVNKEHAKGVNPYYTYVWQKSEDGGVTWYNLDNAANSNVLKDVVFETDQTQYRLAAFPVASSGWIAPAAGVYSDPVSVKTQDTEVTITMKDEAGVAISNKENRFENTEVNVTVNVSGVADYVEGSKGYVKLEVVRYHTNSTRETVYATTGEVDNSGNVTFKVTLPAYSYKPGELSNQVNFVATYSGDDHFTGSELNVGQAFVNLQSAAITWPQDAAGSDAFVKDITIYEGTDTSATGTTTDTMVANETYTLKLPTIYSGDVFSSSGNRKDVALTVNEDYTVVWQYRPMGETTNEWRTLDAASADTCVVICKEGQEDYSYRAVITPMGDYTFAMDDTFGKLTATKTLTTNPTADTVLADTTTDLTITGTVAEANNVKIYNDTPFAILTGEEHYTQYEGETVTLKAKVVDADGNLVPSGYVYFYRVDETDNSQNHVRLNTEYVEVKNGFAEYTVTICDYDEDLATIANVDKFYAVYEANDTYNTSASTETTTTATGLVNYEVPTDVADMVYIRSTAIATPRLTSTENGSRDGDDNKKTTTWTSDLAELPAAVKISFSLMRTAGNETEGYSVVGTDGRWLTNGTDYTIQWYREDKTVEDGGEETGSLKAIDGATQVTYTKAAAENFQKYCVEVIAAGHMKTGAMSKQAIIGKTADPVLDLNPGYTFTEADATFASGVDTTSGAHYGDEVTLTATVQGDETTNALPTGTVTFYYRVERSDGGYTWTQLTDPIDLQQKDVSENKLVAVATYTFNSSELPFNVDRIGFSYSGDDYYSAYSAASMQTAVTGAEYGKMEFKLWSVQISNPEHEAGEVNPADKNYTDAACYPDGKDYGNVTINIYEFSENADGYKGNLVGATADAEYPDIVANTKYTLEVQDIYTKNGEKLELAHDNSADYTIEWFKSTDGGLTWGPLPETEYTNIDAKTIAVTPETKDYKYMVKVTTTNSFYNEEMPSLVDFEYSEKNVNTILQTVSVDVQAVAETPVNNVDEWVYQSNPITLFATVTPTNNGEPSGHVEFYYGFAKEGSAEGDYSEVEWTAVKSDTESGTNVAELVKTTSGTDTDGVMVAQLTTSNLPVTTDGTYSQLVIKAVYTGDQTYAKQDNINGTVSISSDVVTVFSSKIRQDVENISNKVLTFSGNDWTSTTGATGDLYDGVIITAKQLVSDGTKTVITLNPVYTLDVIDREDAIFTDLSSIYTLTAGVDYTVEWQYCENYTAYKEYLDDPATNDKNWMIVDNASVSSDFCTVEQVQGYAYRAVITPCDTEKAQKSFLDNDEIYTNILVVGDAEARVLTNIRKASSASVKGETVYIDAIIMGGTTTPVGNVTVTVTEKGATEPVFTDNRNLVNGWTTFTWENVQAGEYTIKTVLTGNNGYVGETEQGYIVRFTDKVNDGDLTMSVTNKTVTYDGQVQMLDASDVTINGFGEKYTDWQTMAENYVTFQYFDKDGNRVAEPVDAGEYTVKAYLPESMYWGYVTANGTLTIEKRALSIADVTAQAKTYDGTKTVYVQNVELELSAQDPDTGLPINDKGLVEGDSVYVYATAHVDATYAGKRLLELDSAELEGPDDNNYVIANPKYSENFVVSRNQLYGDAVESITAAPGYQITDEDFYMIDQAGNQITAADATITYYYHTGNDILKVTKTNGEGKYTVVISMPESNYKGGLTTTLYIKEGATTKREGDVVKTATSALAYITDTNHVYDGTPKAVTVETTNNAPYTVSYAGANGTYSTDKPVDAGRYMVKVETAGQTYYGIMTIVKGEPQFTFTAETVDYDGDRYNGSLNLVETTNYNVLSAAQKYGELYYTYVGGSIVGYDYNAPRDVSCTVDPYTSGAYGAYMVTAHVPETANTIAVTPSAAFEIKKIELKVVGDDIYTRLFDTHSKLTSTYDGFVGDKYGNDSELRDLIALPTYKLGDHELLSNADMSQVGYLTIHQSDVNARNYYLTYVDGEAAINEAPTQDALEIRNIPNTIYFRDTFQLFLYGSRGELVSGNGTATCEASKVTWSSSDHSIATVDEEGNVNITGVGQFTITAVRGDDPDTQIKTSVDLTAKARRNDVVIARDDYLYDGTAKYVDEANFHYYYMQHGTRFESQDLSGKNLCTVEGDGKIDAGEYPVTAKITGATKNVGDGAGLLAIHRVNSTVTPDGETAVYGNGFPGGDYTARPIVSGDTLDDVLANGLVAADVRTNSDVDHYEILVAGGTEGWNYNVTYAPYAYSETNVNDFDVTQKTLTFTVGSLEDTEGMTKNWRKKDGTLAGTFKELPDAAFMQNDIRTFGELNQVLDYQTSDLITGDSIADLWDNWKVSSRDNANFAELFTGDNLEVEGAANKKLNNAGEIIYEYGTLGHEPMEGNISNGDYVITGHTNSRNYNVTIENGRLDVEQRVVKMTAPTSGIVINGGEYTSEKLAEAIANQMVIEGLAEKLDHIIKDLRLSVVDVTGSQTIAGGSYTYTLKIGNTNYCTEGGGDTIEVPVTVTNITAKATIYNSGATGFKVRIYGMFDGQTRPEHINELKYTILDRNTGAVVRTGTMTYVKDETVNGILQAVYETSYAQLPNGNYTIRFEAAGYSFSY